MTLSRELNEYFLIDIFGSEEMVILMDLANWL